MAQMKPEFEKGDYVSWKYGAGKATGYIVEKLTEPAKLGTKKFQASPEEPKYKIKSDKSGKMAIRNPETLEKINDGEHQGEDDRVHDQNGAEEEDEDEEVHAEEGTETVEPTEEAQEKVHPNGTHKAPDGEENGSRKKQKSEPAGEKTVDDVAAVEEPVWQLGGDEAEKTNGTAEDTNGKEDKDEEIDVHESKEKEEAPHRMPHEELPQPGEFTDLNAV